MEMTDAFSRIEAGGFLARPIVYRYRHCPTCRRDWPAKHSHCPSCVRWLGDHPLERTEWQIVPPRAEPSEAVDYRLIGASAIILRFISDVPPKRRVATMFHEVLAATDEGSARAVPDHGWLVWTTGGSRIAFLKALEIERNLTLSLRQIDGNPTERFRWGIWIDQYVVPFDAHDRPAISDITARAIFNFEPDNVLLCSNSVIETNRHWEHFVCVPRRVLQGTERQGYRFLDHKRPSALDHAKIADQSRFIGREVELTLLDSCYRRSRTTHSRTALLAEAGCGKTRLVREWRGRHSGLRVTAASFSLFGGDIAAFAGQLADIPSDRITTEALLGSVITRIDAKQIDVVVLDDLHWADEESIVFITRLLDALSSRAILILLVARPSGRPLVEHLSPTVQIELQPLPLPAAEDMALRLIQSPRVAEVAIRRSKGNPLFLEQFAAWAEESDYQGTGDAPENLHQLVAVRIAGLSKSRLAGIQQTLRWGPPWERRSVEQQLEQLELEIGLWLDRLETGDYGDRVEVSRHLSALEQLDFEIFLACNFVGKPRARSSRLREAIERLRVGSADQILADLRNRAIGADTAERANILYEAWRAGDAMARHYNWPFATEFYALALTLANSWQRDEIAARLADCQHRCAAGPREISAEAAELRLDEEPAVNALRLPEVWLRLGHRFGSAAYFIRTAEAAEAINDHALAAWAKKLAQMT